MALPPCFGNGQRRLLAQTNRQMLHATQLRFVHPVKKKEMAFEAPPPEDMQSVLDML